VIDLDSEDNELAQVARSLVGFAGSTAPCTSPQCLKNIEAAEKATVVAKENGKKVSARIDHLKKHGIPLGMKPGSEQAEKYLARNKKRKKQLASFSASVSRRRRRRRTKKKAAPKKAAPKKADPKKADPKKADPNAPRPPCKNTHKFCNMNMLYKKPPTWKYPVKDYCKRSHRESMYPLEADRGKFVRKHCLKTCACILDTWRIPTGWLKASGGSCKKGPWFCATITLHKLRKLLKDGKTSGVDLEAAGKQAHAMAEDLRAKHPKLAAELDKLSAKFRHAACKDTDMRVRKNHPRKGSLPYCKPVDSYRIGIMYARYLWHRRRRYSSMNTITWAKKSTDFCKFAASSRRRKEAYMMKKYCPVTCGICHIERAAKKKAAPPKKKAAPKK